ncbi:MAG: four helix bundle protein [Lachnospiraceae bacterium]|nr:four helix bundle protein [Lachnospiraceae bacterium]
MSTKQSELSVITKAKDLSSYVMTVTQKSPKQFRFTLVARLQNYTLDIIEYLYKANDIFVRPGDARSAEKRRNLQGNAMTQCRLLTYMAQLSMDQGAILPKQYEQITQKVYEVMNLLGAWIKSDEKRYGNRV